MTPRVWAPESIKEELPFTEMGVKSTVGRHFEGILDMLGLDT